MLICLKGSLDCQSCRAFIDCCGLDVQEAFEIAHRELPELTEV